jgi:SAM-dependent methyltransferase
MSLRESMVHKLILKKGFTYYPEDEFLVRKVLSFASSENPRVLDVGCGSGHYSFLFEKCGANVVGFDYSTQFIKENKRKADLAGSSVIFITADGNYPEKYFTDPAFDIIFMSGFSLFATEISQPLMEKYLNLLNHNGVLVFIQNSDLRGNIRKTGIRNYSIAQLTDEFSQLNCNIKKVFFYDRHIIGRILHTYAFSDISTACHRLITRLSGLPCNIVMIISRREDEGTF